MDLLYAFHNVNYSSQHWILHILKSCGCGQQGAIWKMSTRTFSPKSLSFQRLSTLKWCLQVKISRKIMYYFIWTENYQAPYAWCVGAPLIYRIWTKGVWGKRRRFFERRTESKMKLERYCMCLCPLFPVSSKLGVGWSKVIVSFNPHNYRHFCIKNFTVNFFTVDEVAGRRESM